jgi:hypothetical protein
MINNCVNQYSGFGRTTMEIASRSTLCTTMTVHTRTRKLQAHRESEAVGILFSLQFKTFFDKIIILIVIFIGLFMELFVGSQSYQDFYTMNAGVKVVVHARNITPLVKYDGSTASVGEATQMSIARTSITKLGFIIYFN